MEISHFGLHREESYISAVEYYKYRSAITKFRTYQSKRVGGKVSITLNSDVKNASIMMLGMKNTVSFLL